MCYNLDNNSKEMLKTILKIYNKNNKDEVIVINDLFKLMNINEIEFNKCIRQLDNNELITALWAGNNPIVITLTSDGVCYFSNIDNNL